MSGGPHDDGRYDGAGHDGGGAPGQPGRSCRRTPAVLALYLDGDIGLPAESGPGAASCGDESGFDFVCPETLAEHLRNCASCRSELRRARRLDAMLAEGSGRVLAEHLASERGLDDLCARWFASERYAVPQPAEALEVQVGELPVDAVQSGGDEPAAPPGPLARGTVAAEPDRALAAAAGVSATAAAHARVRARQARAAAWHRRAPLLAASCGGLLLVVVCGYLGRLDLRQHNHAQRDLQQAQRAPDQTASIAPAAPAPDSPAPAAAAKASPMPLRTTSSARTPAPADGAAPPRRRTELAALPIDTAVEVRRLADRNGLPGVRVAAARLLALAARPGMPKAAATMADLLTALATARSPAASGTAGAADGLAAVHEALRQEPQFVAHLRTCLQRLENPPRAADLTDLAAFTIATRLGSRELDLAVQRLVRRRPEFVESLAAALRSGSRPQGGAQLLLSVWSDLAERGNLAGRGVVADDSSTGPRWFAGQPLALFAEVAAELTATRSAPHRVRCLLALGQCPQPDHLDVLIAWSGTGCRSEAYAAAFALASAPAPWLRPLAARAAQDRDAFLLRAALARAELPEASAWVEPLALPPADRELLAHGSLQQFPTVAAWFRDRAPLGD